MICSPAALPVCAPRPQTPRTETPAVVTTVETQALVRRSTPVHLQRPGSGRQAPTSELQRLFVLSSHPAALINLSLILQTHQQASIKVRRSLSSRCHHAYRDTQHLYETLLEVEVEIERHAMRQVQLSRKRPPPPSSFSPQDSLPASQPPTPPPSSSPTI